jgi:Smg protein
MFEVLVFVYENYWSGESCPEPADLQQKLSAVGFDTEEIQDALTWLHDLSLAAREQSAAIAPAGAGHSAQEASKIDAIAQSPHSLRVYTAAEQNHLGAPCLGFVTFLENAGALPSPLREIVLERAMAAPANPLALEDFKVIVLMVFWRLGLEPDALILDELCDDGASRVAH